MKILSRKNGVALVAVLTVLLVLTLLLPVMFRTSETATYSSVNELNRQKAGYLARTGAEMAVATLRTTLKDESYKEFYAALKNDQKTANATYGITKDADGHLQVSMEPISLYIKEGINGAADEPLYLSGAETPTDSGFKFVGKTEITITFNSDTEYYDAETHKKVEKNVACSPVKVNGVEIDESIVEINEGYLAIYNNNFMVKSTATVNGHKATRTAAVIETRDMYNSDHNKSFIAYTQQKWSLAPDFVKIIEGDYPTPKNGASDVNYSYGGNHVMANPFMATSKKKIKAFGKNISGVELDSDSYYDKEVYIFSTIGNMHINLPAGTNEYVTVLDHDGKKGGNVTNYLALGAYPGLNWRVFENTTSDNKTALQGVNYDGYSDQQQRYNFLSFCATDTLKVSLPIELRVNPKRSDREGDHEFGVYEPNATLFKVMNFQAKDIVFEKRIDIFISICDQEFKFDITGLGKTVVSDGDQVAYRGGFVNLTTPANSPYSYFNQDRGKTVSAGIVYFTEPVYLWFQDWNALGTDTLLKTKNNDGGETMFRTGQVSQSTQWKTISSNPLMQEAVSGVEDLRVFKLFEAGDVYYFNADITTEIDGVDSNVGVNLANWFLETKYYPVSKSEKDIWDYIFHLKETLYTTQVADLIAKNGNYVLDDMHYIGNMNEDPTLLPPNIDNELYVVWDN